MTVPSDLADFMREVWSMIEWHDERVESVSDDAIQAPNIAPVIGGVINVKSKYFSFRYTACEDPETFWKLALFDDQIQDIAEGRVTTLTLWQCATKGCNHLFTNKSDGWCMCAPFGWARDKE